MSGPVPALPGFRVGSVPNSFQRSVVLLGMKEDAIIHLVWVVMPLLERFEKDPYGLSNDELKTLDDYQRSRHSKGLLASHLLRASSQ